MALFILAKNEFGGGRVAEKAATGITEQLVNFGFDSNRLKTGTPPRIDGRSLDYSKMEEQKGDDEIVGFSYLRYPKLKPNSNEAATLLIPMLKFMIF